MWEKSSRQVPCAYRLLAVLHRLQCRAPASLLCLCSVFRHPAAKLATLVSRLHSRHHALSPHELLQDSCLRTYDSLQVMGKNKVLCKVHPEGK